MTTTKGKVAFAFALFFGMIASVSPASASARTQTPAVHQHGSTVHDRSPRLHIHESQPHH